MPRPPNPPPGWTEEQETFIQECADNDSSWAGSPLFVSPEHRKFAKQKLFSAKRSRQRLSLSPKRSPIMKGTKHVDDALTEQMKGLLKEIPKHLIYQLFPGAGNQDDILLGLAENLILPDGNTTISAVIVLHPMLSVFYHSWGVRAKLIEFLTAKTDDGPGNEKTHAIKMHLPTLYNILTAKHGMDASEPDQTNSEKVTIAMAKAADGQEVVMHNCCGRMYNDLKNLGNMKTVIYAFPTPEAMGAKPGNKNTTKKPLSYSTTSFNDGDGSSLKPIPIPTKLLKSVPVSGGADKKITDSVLLYGYIIPIEGTESGTDIKSPTSSNDTEFADLFAG